MPAMTGTGFRGLRSAGRHVRDADGEPAAATDVRDRDLAAVGLDEPARDRQPQAAAGAAGASRLAAEGDIEHARQVALRDPAARVADRHPAAPLVPAAGDD